MRRKFFNVEYQGFVVVVVVVAVVVEYQELYLLLNNNCIKAKIAKGHGK
jgi:hypothetical protein